jgi:hypothetical protein
MGATKHGEWEEQIPALTLHDVGRLTKRGLSRWMRSGEGGRRQAASTRCWELTRGHALPCRSCVLRECIHTCTFLLNLTTCVKDCSCALEFDVVYLS